MKQTAYLPSPYRGEQARWRRYSSDSLLAIAGALLVTGILFLFKLYPRIPNISVAYLLIVLALASTRGMFAAVVASVVAFLSFDYFLVPPLFTLNVGKVDEWLALFIFLATAITTGQLASAMRRRAEQARKRARESSILYELLRDTNREGDVERQLLIIARAVVDVFAPWGVRDCAILLPDERGKLVMQANTRGMDKPETPSPDEAATAVWVMTQGQTAELHDVLPAPRFSGSLTQRVIVRNTAVEHPVRRFERMVPLKLGQRVVGVLRLSMEDDPRLFDLERNLGVEREHSQPDAAFFWTFVDQAAAVIERERLRRESLQVEVLQRTDALRAALLSSISHDLRTPLSSIKASASSLLQEDVQWDEEARRSFALAIEREADRLNRLVANLLDMSRIEAGVLKPEKEWYPLDELIHDVLGRMQPMLQGREVHTGIPDDLPPVELDYLQIDQVLTNLLENVIRHTPPGSPVDISAQVCEDSIMLSVADRGPGVPAADTERIFDKFYRVLSSEKAARTTGSGLGLAVSRGLVEAHGGRIWVENRPGGGAVFRFTLPLRKAEGIQHE